MIPRGIALTSRPFIPVSPPVASPASAFSGVSATAKAGGALGLILGAVSVIGALGGESFRDKQLAGLGMQYDPVSGKAVLANSSPFFGGKFQDVQQTRLPATFSGGQSLGVLYNGVVRYKIAGFSEIYSHAYVNQNVSGETHQDAAQLSGGISYVGTARNEGYTGIVVKNNSGVVVAHYASGTYPVSFQNSDPDPFATVFLSASFARADGQPDTGGNPLGQLIELIGTLSSKGSEKPSDREKRIGALPPNYQPQLSNINNKLNELLGKVNGLSGALGAQSRLLNANLNKDGSVNRSPSPVPTVAPSPASTPNRTPTPSITPSPNRNPDDRDRRTPPPIDFGANSSLAQNIAQIGAISSLIYSQTTPDAQRNNSKNGSCDALQSPSCTKGVEDRIKNPLSNQIGNVASTVDLAKNVIDDTSTKVSGIRTFLEKVARSAKLDKVYNFLTFITVVHNAQMLSSSLSTTLMDALSLGLATFNIKDENEAPIDIQSIVNKSVEDTVKSIVGEANYNAISERWKKAMTVYRASMNMLYQVRSLWDSTRSLNEMTGANVGQLMNALRKDGVVSENAYPAKSESPQMVNSFMTRLENLDEAASVLQGITSETSSMVETVAQLNKDRQDFEKLVKESPKKAGVENDAAKAQNDAEKTASVSPAIPNTALSKPDTP